MKKTSTGTAYERIRTALESGGHTTIDTGHGKLRAQCPAHISATTASRPLAVADKDGRALLICHAGCDYTSVLEALGLTPQDLFDESKSRMMPAWFSKLRHVDLPISVISDCTAPDTSRDYLRALVERFGSVTEAGRARAETLHVSLCAHCRSERVGGPHWWGRFCADCATGWGKSVV